ncbi:MAG: hypothetical protein K5841_05260 [Fretibacterium sp.]|nr:hypothetical protein [Fretibacterium sp.]
MYFLWKRTQHGMVQISGEGLADFIRGFLSAKCRLCSLALAAGCSLHSIIPASTDQASPPADDTLAVVLSLMDVSSRPGIEKKLTFLMRPMGLAPLVVWATPEEELLDLLKSPWLWMALASSIALAVIAGWAGFFWTAFCGTATWFVARGLSLLCRLATRKGRRPGFDGPPEGAESLCSPETEGSSLR